MNIYKITRVDSGYSIYDTFDSAIVIASSVKEAQKIHPRQEFKNQKVFNPESDWTTPENVDVELLGVLNDVYANTNPKEVVILASWNEG